MFKEYIDSYNKKLLPVLQNIDADEFRRVIETLRDAYQNDKQVFIAGNGGSAGTANHFVCDFGKNAVLDPEKRRFRIISLSDNVEKITAFGNDIEFAEIFRQQLINLMNEGDVLMLISASGNSPDLVRAAEYAKEKNAKILSFAGFQGGKIKQVSDACIVAPLESYEMIEDVHLVLMHMIVYFFKNNPDYLQS